MIELQVENYCSKCPDFEPTVSRIYAEDDIYMQFIHCEHHVRCAKIYTYMKEELKGETK